MEFLSEFGLAVVSAAILQNVVLTRGLGSCKRTLTLPAGRPAAAAEILHSPGMSRLDRRRGPRRNGGVYHAGH